jgi:phage terminase large subunit
MTGEIKLTTAYYKIKALNKKIKVIQGGQGASKTYSILILILEKCLTKKLRCTIVTESYPQLRDGVISDFKSIVENAGLDWSAHYNGSSNNLYLFGSVIEFRNIDNKDFHRAKGARRNILFINEANRTSYATVEQMMTRTTDEIYIDFNPDREFWVHTETINRPDADFIILTYKDNECIDPGERSEIEAKRNKPEWWRVYGEGQLGTYSDRRIYDFKLVDAIPTTAREIPLALDFGVSPDPTWLGELFLDENRLYINELICENNLMPEKIAGAKRTSIVDRFNEKQISKGKKIIADSAGRTEIIDLRRHGFNVFPVHKSPGSVLEGTNKLRGYELYLTKGSANIRKGIENFFWKQDKNGKIVPEIEGHEPDGVAAVRYVIMSKGILWK